jgi:acetyl-CoA synthetase
VVESDGSERALSFARMSARSNQVASWLRGQGVARGDRLILMLGNQVELWETILAAMKLGAVLIPATTLLGPEDLVDRVERGRARHVITTAADAVKFDAVAGDYTRIAVGGPVDGWLDYGAADAASAEFAPDGPTRGGRPAASVLSRPARRRSRSSSSTRTPRTRQAISPRCTGSGSGPATCT